MNMPNNRAESIWVDHEFYNILKTRIVRDRKERRVHQKLMPQQKFYDSFQSATRDLTPELKKFFKQ
jgi:hypothetical protein